MVLVNVSLQLQNFGSVLFGEVHQAFARVVRQRNKLGDFNRVVWDNPDVDRPRFLTIFSR